MQIRNPAVAGQFYPFSSGKLEGMIEDFLKVKTDEVNAIGFVSPHAGYVFSGKTAGFVYSMIKDFDIVVILGPNHSGLGSPVATCSGVWKTPLGSAEIDEEFVEELTKNSIIVNDSKAHLREHSIEVQLPFLQHKFKEFKFVPISINPIYFKKEHCKAIGDKIAETAEKLKKKIIIIASSDFTHYGKMYSYVPFRGPTSQILKKIKEMDMEIIKYTEKMMPERIIEVCDDKRLTICGYGAISAMLWAAKKLGAKQGKLLKYSTSFDVSRDINAVVAYAGIAIF